MSLERVRRHPTRYLVPNVLTAARPFIGWKALQEAKKGNWIEARNGFAAAWVTDLEGTPARFLHATSDFGAFADPVADFGLRVEMVAAFLPVMNKVAATVIAAAEIDNLRLNAHIQKGRKTPLVPKGAKWGAVLQGVGGAIFCNAMEKKNPLQKAVGEATLVAGTALRNQSYRTLYKREKA